MISAAFLQNPTTCALVFSGPPSSQETAARTRVGWEGRGSQITSDFSDRKLGENLRKWLSGPARREKKKRKTRPHVRRQ